MAEYFIEYHRIGNHVKVTAIDPETGKEVMIIGPTNASKKSLSDLAIKKLRHVMGKEQSDEGDEDTETV